MQTISIESIFSNKKLRSSIYKISHHKSCSGVDGVEYCEVAEYWKSHSEEIISAIKNGKYKPQPMKTIIIKKSNGEKRIIHVACMVDKVILNTLYAGLVDYYEKKFSPYSYGYRRDRNSEQAAGKVSEYLKQGYRYVVNIDIQGFFDNVDHTILLKLLSRDIKDDKVCALIKEYLKPQILYKNYIYKKKIGIVQGYSLSPLLANIYLNELDKWMDKQYKVKFVRYADDIVLLCRSMQDAERVMTDVETVLNTRLNLKINHNKSGVETSEQLEYLGYSFLKKPYGEYELTVSEKAKKKMLERMKKHMNSFAISPEKWWIKVSGFNQGWLNYYRNIDFSHIRLWIEQTEEFENECIMEHINQDKKNPRKAYLESFYSGNYSSLSGWIKRLERKKYGK